MGDSIDVSKKSPITRERLIGVVALLSVLAAWYLGTARNATNLQEHFQAIFPATSTQANSFEPQPGGSFRVLQGNTVLGYIGDAANDGYGGPLRVLVGIDLQGYVTGLRIVEQRETPSYLKRVLAAKYLDQFPGKPYNDHFTLRRDIDAVSGATSTSSAIASSIRDASRAVAVTHLGKQVPELEKIKVIFGVPEIVLVGLFLLSFLSIKVKAGVAKYIRWVCLLVGLIVLGFMYNTPMSLVYVNKILMGYWPTWQNHLYWYLLTGGIVFFVIVENRNLYCHSICPFGAAQECVNTIGGAGPRKSVRYRQTFRWVHRCLAWLAILLALIFRNPSASSYEVFGALFQFVGSSVQFALLGLVLVAAIFLRRPWCRYLCPVSPVIDYVRMMRNWGRSLWGGK